MHSDVSLWQLLYHVFHLHLPLHPKMVFILSHHNLSGSAEGISSLVLAKRLLYNHALNSKMLSRQRFSYGGQEADLAM